MAYKNKTFISFASEDIRSYRLMTAWKKNENIDFDFFDAHDLNTARDTSKPETIKRKLRERLSNTKQIILLIGDKTKSKSAKKDTFIHYEVEVIKDLGIPIIFVNLNQDRKSDNSRIPTALNKLYTMSTSFQPKIIKYALDDFISKYIVNEKKKEDDDEKKKGLYHYTAKVYKDLNL
jgi:hypothetical protein